MAKSGQCSSHQRQPLQRWEFSTCGPPWASRLRHCRGQNGRSLGVLLVGALLGSTGGALSAGTYLLAGAAGAPVFAAGGGAGYLLGPTGGYLLGFLPAAWLTGLLFERGWGRRRITALLALGIGDAALFLPGLAWLAMFVPAKALLPAGLISFMPGEAIKIPLAAILLSRLRR